MRALWLFIPAVLTLAACSSLKQALSNKECRLQPERPYDVVTIDPDHHAIELVWKDENGEPLQTLINALSMLQARGDSVVALTNGGIYTRALVPLGLYVEDGKALVPVNHGDGYGNFYLKPNGILMISGNNVRILETSQFDDAIRTPEYALQSGPLLVHNGSVHPAFTPGSTNCRLRSGIGVDREGRVHLVVSNGAVNFHDFATLFKQNLGCDNALYLDGAISVLYAPVIGRHARSRTHFAAFLAVIAKARESVAPPGFEPGTSWSRARRSAN